MLEQGYQLSDSDHIFPLISGKKCGEIHN